MKRDRGKDNRGGKESTRRHGDVAWVKYLGKDNTDGHRQSLPTRRNTQKVFSVYSYWLFALTSKVG